MRVLFVAGREIGYARNDVLLRALRRLGRVDAVACTAHPRSLVLNSLQVAARAAAHLLRRRYDLVFVGFYGYLIVRLMGSFVRSPLLFDAFVSNYDTLCFDRQVCAPGSPVGRLACWLDRSTCQRATRVLLDTQGHVDYFVHTFGLAPDHFDTLPVGCNEDIFAPRPTPEPGPITRILYYSTFLPLHGADTVMQAAVLLAQEPVHFRLIGHGPQLAAVQALAERERLTNVTFAPPVPIHALADAIEAADICLGGHFGHSEKAGRVIPGKVYQILAMARPLIAADTTGNRELLRHGETAYLVPPARPQALATAIRHLHADGRIRAQLAVQGRTLYESRCSEAVITERLAGIIRDMLAR